MDINRTYDVPPDGFEVESATLHLPSEPLIDSEPVRGGSFMDRLKSFRRVGVDRLHGFSHTLGDRSSWARSHAIEKLNSLQHTWSDRATTMRERVTTRINDLKPVVRERAMQLKDDVRGNAGKWAGIAAGAGLALGIGGRIVRHRMYDRAMPSVVIIESTC